MKRLFVLISSVLIFNSIASGQLAQINIPITATNGSYSRVLYLGLDTSATTDIDTHLGESPIPPVPPGTFPFDIRFDLDSYGYTFTTWKDYRHADFLFTGVVQHTLWWQLSNPNSALVLHYALPTGAAMNIKDRITGGQIYNSGSLTGTGNYIIPNSAVAAIVTMTYTNIHPEITLPIFSISPLELHFGMVNQNGKLLYTTVTNTGNFPLVIFDISSTNSHFYDYGTLSTPFTIASGANGIISIQFTPGTLLGLQTGNLIIDHNAPGSPAIIPMDGSRYPGPAIFDSITVTDQVGHSKVLVFGMDPSATDSIDFLLGENYLPPLPPWGAFDARFYLPKNGFSGVISSWKDFRGIPSMPWIGEATFVFNYQLGEGSPGAKISWQLPNYLYGLLQDMFGGALINVPNPFGEEISVLVNEFQQPSEYTVQFNSKGLASGVYFYKLTSGNFTHTRKMLLIK